jgi:signal transduction histidine kinase
MPFQIKQLFENLITNSIQYRQPNIRPCITVTSRVVGRKDIPEHFDKTNERYYKIEITDNGIGFEQAFAEKAFQLFQRLHTKNGQPGTGIGLTICQKIVHNHNGFIHAKSQVNKGTTFEIYLPVM